MWYLSVRKSNHFDVVFRPLRSIPRKTVWYVPNISTWKENPTSLGGKLIE